MENLVLFEWEAEAVEGGKVCSSCRQERPLECFAPDRRYRLGVYHCCRQCLRQQSRAIKDVDYVLHLLAQDGVCAVCRRPPDEGERFDIDHDHQTDAIRGLLCRRCNVGYGMLGESQEIIASLLAYHISWARRSADPDLRLGAFRPVAGTPV